MEPATETAAPAKPKKAKAKKKPAKGAKRGRKPGNIVRGERLDMRLSKAEKAKVLTLAKKKGVTVTAVVLGAIGKLR